MSETLTTSAPLTLAELADLAECEGCGGHASHIILVPWRSRSGELGESWEGTCSHCYPTTETWPSASMVLARQAAELAALPAPRYGILAEPTPFTIDEPAEPQTPAPCSCWHAAPFTPQDSETCGWCSSAPPAAVLTARMAEPAATIRPELAAALVGSAR